MLYLCSDGEAEFYDSASIVTQSKHRFVLARDIGRLEIQIHDLHYFQ